jgi:PAP2 superfamily
VANGLAGSMTDFTTEIATTTTSTTSTADFFRTASCCWAVVAIISAVDVIWLWRDGISIASKPFIHFTMIVVYFAAIAWLLRKGRPTFVKSAAARVCGATAQVFALVMVVAPFSYLLDSLRLPLIDHSLHTIDDALGFNWKNYSNFIFKRPPIARILADVYSSMELQILVILLICCAGKLRREIEFLQNYALTMILCVVIGGVFPALGEPSPLWAVEPAEFALARSGHWQILDYSAIQGLVAFPSFHTAFAIVVIYAVRHNLPALFCVGVFNLLLLVSVPTFGGHYLTDMIGGALVALASILTVTRLKKLKPIKWPVTIQWL